jgi:predicted ester cyclase
LERANQDPQSEILRAGSELEDDRSLKGRLGGTTRRSAICGICPAAASAARNPFNRAKALFLNAVLSKKVVSFSLRTPYSMNPIEVVQNNFNNWQRHDAEAIGAAYVQGGTYTHPIQAEPFTNETIVDFAKMVFTGFPDFSLDLVSIGQTGDGLVALEWVYHGTDTGPWTDNRPATGLKVSCPGVSIVQVQGDKILAERVYFDRLSEQKQLGQIKE